MPHPRTRRLRTRRTARVLPEGVLEVMPSGYGFVKTAEGEFFIPESAMKSAFDGDVVAVSRASGGDGNRRVRRTDRPQGRVARVVTRAHASIVGRYEIAEPYGVVVPEDPRIRHDIFTLRRDAPTVREGDIVRVRITAYPEAGQPAFGSIEEVVGHEGDAGIDVDLIVARHTLATCFSDDALAQAASAEAGIDRALRDEGYRDLRHRITFTIDPSDACDFDDALSFDEVDGLLRVGVHIADVSRYVSWATPLDLEARARATSVYLVDRVLPMLPEKLSNDICSLKPNVARRAVTVDLYYSHTLDLVRADAYPAVIESKARFVYEDVQACLESMCALGSSDLEGRETPRYACSADELSGSCTLDGALRSALGSSVAGDDMHGIRAIAARLESLHRIARALRARRARAGGIDFDREETKVRLDDQGCSLSVDLRRRNDATSLVEEAMISANEAVARIMRDAGAACIYRVHEAPDSGDLIDIVPILDEFGYDDAVSLSAFAMGSPKAVQAVLARAHGRPEGSLVSMLVLRAMKQARYAPECQPHFGLASTAYLHFTSPIRRYPDLMAHRLLKAVLRGRDGTTSAQEAALPAIADHASRQEKVAETAARESQELKMYELLSEHIGEPFDGMVSGVSTSGFYVRIEMGAEGFVPMRDLGEFFHLDSARRMLVGTESGDVVRLGDAVRIRVVAVFPYARTATFALASNRRASRHSRASWRPR